MREDDRRREEEGGGSAAFPQRRDKGPRSRGRDPSPGGEALPGAAAMRAEGRRPR